MLEPGRIFSTTSAYRYGFNGKEQDSILGGGRGIDYDYGFRIYDARAVRFLSVDPLTNKYPELTPYQFASNNPIYNIDIDGKEGAPYLGGFIKEHCSVCYSALEGVGDELKNSYHFVTRDAWKASTWKNAGEFLNETALSMSTVKIANTPMVDAATDNFINNVIKGDANTRTKFVAQTATSLLLAKGAGEAVEGLSALNKVAATNYLSATGDLASFKNVEGFSLRMGTDDYVYHNSLAAAQKTLWSTPTSYGSSSEAFNGLALDYDRTTNFAQMKFPIKNYGLFLKGTAAAKRTTAGGGVQLFQTPISLKTLSTLSAKKFSL